MYKAHTQSNACEKIQEVTMFLELDNKSLEFVTEEVCERVEEAALWLDSYALEFARAAKMPNEFKGAYILIGHIDGPIVLSMRIGNPAEELYASTNALMTIMGCESVIEVDPSTHVQGAAEAGNSLMIAVNGFGKPSNRLLALRALRAAEDIDDKNFTLRRHM